MTDKSYFLLFWYNELSLLYLTESQICISTLNTKTHLYYHYFLTKNLINGSFNLNTFYNPNMYF